MRLFAVVDKAGKLELEARYEACLPSRARVPSVYLEPSRQASWSGQSVAGVFFGFSWPAGWLSGEFVEVKLEPRKSKET